MVMGKSTKKSTKHKTDQKATDAANRQAAEKRALVDKFKEKAGGSDSDKD
ncbi:hypothetical protein [Kitasatospora sp. NPDC093558]